MSAADWGSGATWSGWVPDGGLRGLNGAASFERLSLAAGPYRFDALAAGPADGPLVLLLHGFPQSSYQWRFLLPVLAAAGFRAVAPDQRGYSPGARPEGVGEYDVDCLAEDVLAMADALGADRFHLAGHDWGAIVAWVVAARHPERLLSLTAVSSGHPGAIVKAIESPTGDQAKRSGYVNLFRLPKVPEHVLLAGGGAGLRKLFWNTGYVDRAAVEEYVKVLDGPEAITAALNWYRALDHGVLGAIGPVDVPTLYVWSTDDPALGREAAEATAAFVRGPYRFVELAGVGHWVPEDAADDLTVELLAHLAVPATVAASGAAPREAPMADISKILDKAYEDKSFSELASAPVSALQGVSESDAAALKQAFGIDTIRELATNKFVLWAQAINVLAK